MDSQTLRLSDSTTHRLIDSHMKQCILILLLGMIVFTGTAQEITKNKQWKLAWSDEFNHRREFDTTVWSKIPRKHVPWAKYMSDHEACYDVRKGKLILRGIKNPDRNLDTATYLTGGLYTLGKRSFWGGRLEIKAKLQGAQGAWPAIWLLPADPKKYPWPSGGEIDIMERLNYDSIAYQTVHSHYTFNLNITNNPPQSKTGPIDPDAYNVYAVEIYPDRVVFFINDNYTFTYPRINTDKEGQFPYYKPMYLLIDMQLGGNWGGPVEPNDLPVEMKVDWVRYYTEE